MLAGYSLAVVCELLIVAASLVVECWALGHMRFSIVARGHSCPKASGIFPDQGSNPCPPCSDRWIPNHGTTREVLITSFNFLT